MEPEWHPDLVVMGYKAPLPLPIPAIQATLFVIQNIEIHEFVQQTDSATLEAAGEESETAPLLFTILDLSLWTRVFEFANSKVLADRQKALDRLCGFYDVLPKLVAQDFEEVELAEENSQIVESVLQIANPNANLDADKGLGLSSHSFLMDLMIDSLNKAALEDFEDAITNSQVEAEQSTLIPSGKRTVIPFKPPRAVEDEVAQKEHKYWKLGNLNLAAPISRSTWRIWADLKPAEIEESREQALWGKNFITSGTSFSHAFPISAFDYRKCDVPLIKLHVKQPCPTGSDRRPSHSKEMWNIFRPYLHFTCSALAVRACNGSMVWWNHPVWYVLNHLDKFFPHSEHPSLMAKFVAFIIWVSGLGRLATHCQIVFNQTRSWMCLAVLQYAKNLMDDCVILPGLPEAGPRMIKRHIKSKGFSIANPKLPSLGPPSKKQKINLNSVPTASGYGNNHTKQTAFARGGKKAGGRYGGRNQGGRGFNTGRGRGSSYQPNGRSDKESSVNGQREQRVLAPGQKVCGMFGQTSTGQEPTYISAAKATQMVADPANTRSRVLDFLEE